MVVSMISCNGGAQTEATEGVNDSDSVVLCDSVDSISVDSVCMM